MSTIHNSMSTYSRTIKLFAMSIICIYFIHKPAEYSRIDIRFLHEPTYTISMNQYLLYSRTRLISSNLVWHFRGPMSTIHKSMAIIFTNQSNIHNVYHVHLLYSQTSLIFSNHIWHFHGSMSTIHKSISTLFTNQSNIHESMSTIHMNQDLQRPHMI